VEREQRGDREDRAGCQDSLFAALIPAAAAGTLVFARLLPIRFEYRPNDLGVVSATTLAQYPTQQEIFWLLFAALVASLLTWVSLYLLRGAQPLGRAGIALEALGVLGLFGLLYLPALAGGLLFLGCLGSGGLLLQRRSLAARSAPLDASASSPPSLVPWGRWSVFIVLVALLSTSFSPRDAGFFAGLAGLVHGAGDLRLTSDTWLCVGEYGQHLFWADSIRQGGFQGLDFFSLYGPLQSLGLVGAWSVLGRSIATYEAYLGLRLALGMAAFLTLVLVLVRNRGVLLVAPLLVPFVSLRVGLGLAGLCLLSRCLAGRATVAAPLAGFVSGIAVLFSQEFGLALGAVSVLALALRADLRIALGFTTGWAFPVVAVALWFLEGGALQAMVADIVGYPVAMTAGFGNLPFPSLLQRLPLDLAPWRDVKIRVAYSVPAILVGAALLALPLRELDVRSPSASLLRVRTVLLADPARATTLLTALFGLLAFRSALGRSDAPHIFATIPMSAAVLLVGLDRTVAFWRDPSRRALATWRTALLVLFVFQSGFVAAARPWDKVLHARREIAQVVDGPAARGDSRVRWLVAWIRQQTRPDEKVWFLPNIPVYYYLTERPNPTRFAMGSQIITNAHREEVLADLATNPPGYVVWDQRNLRIDDIPDRLNLGAEIMAWLDSHYVTRLEERDFVILERRKPSRPDVNRPRGNP
jgi:hypothetical protein